MRTFLVALLWLLVWQIPHARSQPPRKIEPPATEQPKAILPSPPADQTVEPTPPVVVQGSDWATHFALSLLAGLVAALPAVLAFIQSLRNGAVAAANEKKLAAIHAAVVPAPPNGQVVPPQGGTGAVPPIPPEGRGTMSGPILQIPPIPPSRETHA